MEIEKVKEIKEDIEICMKSLTCENCSHQSQRSGECCRNLTNDILTYINELESENELLRNAKVIYETVDYCAEDLRKAQDRIAELEKENAKYKQKLTTNQWVQEIRKEALKQFAERLTEKLDEQKHFYEVASISHRDISLTALNTAYRYLDETLKEFIKE